MELAFVTGGSGFVGGNLIRALVAEGVQVRALARSARAHDQVAALGAHPVDGALEDPAALRAGMAGCEVVFHCGAYLSDWDWERAWRVNVVGTRNVVEAARAAGVKRLVYVSGIGVTVGNGPAIDIDETNARGRPVGVLCATRVQSEAEVEAANSPSLETVVVRFPFVWGPGDTLRPVLVRLVRRRRFRWIGGGRHLVSICHIDNAVRGLLLAASRGRAGASYWIADEASVQLRTFIQAQLAIDGVAAPDRSISLRVATFLADALAFVSRLLRSRRPSALTPTTVRFLGQQITVDTRRARSELGYRPVPGWPEGLFALRPLDQERSDVATPV